jgi:hypothetical protein
MPLITRAQKGSKLSIEEMDGNLTYLEGLAVSSLRDYTQLVNKPLVIDQLDRYNSTKEITIDNTNLYINGPFSLRFANYLGEGGSNPLVRVWDYDGPLGSSPTLIDETTYNERAQISFLMEDAQKSSLSLKSYDWSAGTQSGVEFEYKFYQGSVILPVNTSEPISTDGTVAISDGISWDPTLSGQMDLNVFLDGEWKQVNLGNSVVGPTGPQGEIGPQGVTGPSSIILNAGVDRLLTSNGTDTDVVAQDYLTFDGMTFSITGDLKLTGTIDQPNIKTPTVTFATLQGDTTLQNISTVLVDTLSVTQSTLDFDYTSGSVFYITSVSSDFTVNLINLPTTDSRAINTTIFLSQGVGTYGVTGFEIDGVSQTIKWVGATPPTVLPTSVMAYTFNILRSGSSWVEVLGAGGIYA